MALDLKSLIQKARRRPQSVVGLALDGGRLHAVRAVRSKGGIEILKTASVALEHDLLQPEPDAVGREIRAHLDAAGIGERACVAAVPAAWIMSHHTKLPPDLSAEDTNSFLQLEAEKGFPSDLEQLQIVRSFHRSPEGVYVTQLAVRKERLDHLSSVLKAAGLKPASLTLGLASIPGVLAPQGRGRICVALEPKGAVLLVSAGGGIAAFRTCEAPAEAGEGKGAGTGSALALELRITVEQLPQDLRGDLRQLSLFGDEAALPALADSLGDWARTAGLTIESLRSPDQAFSAQIAESIARRWLEHAASELEFLPPRPGRLEALVTRYNTKRLATVGYAVAGVVAIALIAFGWQEIRVVSLRSQWASMQDEVTSLSTIQDKVRNFQPWNDKSFPDLRILGTVTNCFPDNGSVTAKSIDIERLPTGTTVTISGNSTDEHALLRVQDLLRHAKDIQDLNLPSITGKQPARFTFTFHWIGGPGT